MATQTFSMSGTWTCPGGVTSVQVECWGGGGGGGGPLQVGPTNESGGGGGGGAYAIRTVTVTPGVVYTVTVGNGAAGGSTGNNGATGGDTWFNDTATALAKGGAGGLTGAGAGGAGGNAASCVGDTRYSGGQGGAGQADVTNVGGAGGGSSAGTGAQGNNGVNATGTSGTAGGAAPTGGGAGGNGGTGGAGAVGSAPGGGGGSTAGAFSNKSGNGAAGQVILTWTVVSGPIPFPAMVVRGQDLDDVPLCHRVYQVLNPVVADKYSQPVIPAPVVVREPDRLPPPVQPIWTLQNVQIATRTAAPAARPLQPIVIFSRSHEPVSVAGPVFIRPGVVLADIGVRYGAARMLYRVFNAAEYRFYRSNTATPPQPGDVPYATSATLPATPATTFADGTWLISMSYFNGCIDSGFLPIGPRSETYLTLVISGGVAQATMPGAPMGARLEVRAGGIIRVIAYYLPVADGASAADAWGIAYTTNGSTPASGAASITQAMGSGALQILSYDLPAQAGGTTVKVQLQTKRGSVYSPAGTVMSAVAVVSGPSTPLGIQSWPGVLPPGNEES